MWKERKRGEKKGQSAHCCLLSLCHGSTQPSCCTIWELKNQGLYNFFLFFNTKKWAKIGCWVVVNGSISSRCCKTFSSVLWMVYCCTIYLLVLHIPMRLHFVCLFTIQLWFACHGFQCTNLICWYYFLVGNGGNPPRLLNHWLQQQQQILPQLDSRLDSQAVSSSLNHLSFGGSSPTGMVWEAIRSLNWRRLSWPVNPREKSII